MKLYVSFYVFMASAGYMFLKRFYLHEIIRLAVSFQFLIIEWTLFPIMSYLQKIYNSDLMNYYEQPSLSELVKI